MKRSSVLVSLAGVAFGATLAVRRLWAAKHASLRESDLQFHAEYARLRTAASAEVPVLVLFAETLVLFDGRERLEFPASAPRTEIIKAVSHMPVGIFAALHDREGELDEPTLQVLELMRRTQADTTESLQELAQLDPALHDELESVRQRSLAYLERTLHAGRVSTGELASFASELGPTLLHLIEHATSLELQALHAAVEAALRELPAARQQHLEVVVAGVHQARARSLGLQYFQKRFGEAPGEEKRVAYAEAAADVEEARQLVGVRRLDRDLAMSFFGDETRMQRDLLGDAASRLLANTELESIV